MMIKRISIPLLTLVSLNAAANNCAQLPTHKELTSALKQVVKPTGGMSNGGLDLNMWATIVSRSGEVCQVTMSGKEVGDQWPGSRVISAQKANTANAFSLPGLALSTANLWAPTQPGGSLYGLQHSNPVDTSVAYRGEAIDFGGKNDPMQGSRIGGVNVFGGGLALYNKKGKLLGALGVSGDTSCADHNIAWKLRSTLKLDFVPQGVSATGDDNIIFDLKNGFHHPECGGNEVDVATKLPSSYPTSKS